MGNLKIDSTLTHIFKVENFITCFLFSCINMIPLKTTTLIETQTFSNEFRYRNLTFTNQLDFNEKLRN